MGANRTTFEKLQRDRAKKAKAAAKRAKRHGIDEAAPISTAGPSSTAPASDDWDLGSGDKPLSASELLTLVEQLQQQFDSESISFDEYEERKADLLARLPID